MLTACPAPVAGSHSSNNDTHPGASCCCANLLHHTQDTASSSFLGASLHDGVAKVLSPYVFTTCHQSRYAFGMGFRSVTRHGPHFSVMYRLGVGFFVDFGMKVFPLLMGANTLPKPSVKVLKSLGWREELPGGVPFLAFITSLWIALHSPASGRSRTNAFFTSWTTPGFLLSRLPATFTTSYSSAIASIWAGVGLIQKGRTY